MLKIGHRGAMGYEAENTLVSFSKALELGVDMIELDVYVLKTGELVVIHDDKVDRTTDGHGYVEDMIFNDLRQLDAGKGEKIPTLEEVIDLVDGKVPINIELKGENTAEPVAKLLSEYINNKNYSADDFLISSFDHYELKIFKELMPDIKVGALISGIPIGYSKFAEEVSAYSVHLSLDFTRKKYVDDAHKRGFKVFVYTINDKDDINKMKDLGVDGLFSNYPDRI